MSNFKYIINDFKTDNDSLLVSETIFHNANGYIGIRANFEEGYKDDYKSIRGCYINGLYDTVSMPQAEKLFGFVDEKQTIINVSDVQGIKLLINGNEFSMFEGEIVKSSRELDMESGITVRQVHWKSPSNDEVLITIKRMTSFNYLNLFTIEYEVKALSDNIDVKLTSSHSGDVSNYFDPTDPRVAAEANKHVEIVESFNVNNSTYIISKTAKSNICFATSTTNKYYFNNELVDIDNKTINSNETFKIIKYCVFTDGLRISDDFKSKTVDLTNQLISISINELYESQRNYLKNYWDNCDLIIDGDDELALATRYNLYQLIQSVGKDKHCNIGAKGISGEGYEGHYFWDTEIYIQPFFVLTNPEISRNLIEYRYNILNHARYHAKILGHTKGALYPWRTISGLECSGYFLSGSAQYHINGDIAHSIVAYYLATNDIEFIQDKASEIMFETARLWMDTGTYVNGKFEIHEVTGPDEYTCLVNNNYYTNACAKYNLYWASKFYDVLVKSNNYDVVKKIGLTEEEVLEFKNAAENMLLPYDENLKINPQDDSFLNKKKWDIENTPEEKFPLLLHFHPLYIYRHQVLKQADTVLSHFLFEDYQDIQTIDNSFKYYETITTHDSSLSTCIYSIVASKLNYLDKAYKYFGDSALLDLFNTHKNTKDGIHTANMGGNYMVVVYGFAGLRIKERGLYLSPTIPEKWNKYEFNINYKSSKISFTIDKEQITIKLLEGTKQNIFIYDQEVCIDGETNIKIK